VADVDIVEINLDRYGIYFIPTEIAVHPADGLAALQLTLGPGYQPPIGSEGKCPPNVRFVKVVSDLTVQRGLAHVRRPGGGYTALTLAR
jgi:hypothetical protein